MSQQADAIDLILFFGIFIIFAGITEMIESCEPSAAILAHSDSTILTTTSNNHVNQ